MTGFKLGLLVIFVALATYAGVDVVQQLHPTAASFITVGSYEHWIVAAFGAAIAVVVMMLGFMLRDRHPIPLTFLVITTAFTVLAALARWTGEVNLPFLVDDEKEAIAAVVGLFATALMFFVALFTESSKRAAPPPAP